MSIRTFFASVFRRLGDCTLSIGIIHYAAIGIAPYYNFEKNLLHLEGEKIQLFILMEKFGVYMLISCILISVILDELSEACKPSTATPRQSFKDRIWHLPDQKTQAGQGQGKDQK